MKLCENCGKETANRKFCSLNCYWEAQRKGLIAITCKPWSTGLTKETDKRVEKQSKSLLKSYAEGRISVWSKNLTKEDDPRIMNMSIESSKRQKRESKRIAEKTRRDWENDPERRKKASENCPFLRPDVKEKSAEARRNSEVWLEAIKNSSSKTMKKLWKDPEFRNKIINNPKRIENSKKARYNPESAIHFTQTCKWCGVEFISGRWKTYCNRKCYWESMKGIPLSKPYYMIEDPEIERLRRSKISKTMEGVIFSKETITKRVKSFKENYYNDPIRQIQRSNQTKQAWDRLTPEERNERIRKTFIFPAPNKLEQRFDVFLQKYFPGEYKYVGDGQVVINGKVPDFININSKKKIIEIFGDYWHKDDDPEDRKKIFREFGYDTLVLWERCVNNVGEDVLRDLVCNFTSQDFFHTTDTGIVPE